MRHFSKLALLAAATMLTPPCSRLPRLAAPAAAPKSVPVSTLVSKVSIPHTTFKLKNGLTVIVHEDHKAPVAAVTVWYNVGSKDEPKGKTGFAHLFEHLMFNGTEDLPGDYFTYLQQIGATDYNGTTYYDRTNYFETVPAGALERALFMESDRMGHLLGAVTQGVLDNQRGVVQNEKRQGDSRPGGLVQYALQENLFPAGHPYHHTVIGSMDDLDAASLADVKQWFRDKYGPNNAVLVVAGDVNAGAGAGRWSRNISGRSPRGRSTIRRWRACRRSPRRKSIEMKDHVATTIIQRYWAVPGLLDKQLAALDIGASVLGGLASSRLDKILVRDEKLAVGVSASLNALQRAGIFKVTASVRPGVDPAVVSKRLDEIIADYIAERADRRRSPARGDERSLGPDPRARAGRRLRRQGGLARRRADVRRRQRFLQEDARFLCRDHAGGGARGDAALAHAAGADDHLVAGRARRPMQEAKPVAARPRPRPTRATARVKGNRPLPPVGQLAALDFPDDRPRQAVERDSRSITCSARRCR